MVPVCKRTGEEDEAGMKRLVEAVDKRLSWAGVRLKDAFAADTLKRLCAASGGYLRDLLTLVQSSVSYGGTFPIPSAAVEHAIRDGRDVKAASISLHPRFWKLLQEVAQYKAPVEAEEYPRLLDTLVVLEYRDGDGAWHNVHPLVQETRQFKVPAS
jgi:hypothetical protein